MSAPPLAIGGRLTSPGSLGSTTVTMSRSVALPPRSSVTVRATENSPGWPNMCTGFGRSEEPPSPKSQRYATISPSPVLLDRPSNATGVRTVVVRSVPASARVTALGSLLGVCGTPAHPTSQAAPMAATAIVFLGYDMCILLNSRFAFSAELWSFACPNRRSLSSACCDGKIDLLLHDSASAQRGGYGRQRIDRTVFGPPRQRRRAGPWPLDFIVQSRFQPELSTLIAA